jgi:hypothetical protein
VCNYISKNLSSSHSLAAQPSERTHEFIIMALEKINNHYKKLIRGDIEMKMQFFICSTDAVLQVRVMMKDRKRRINFIHGIYNKLGIEYLLTSLTFMESVLIPEHNMKERSLMNKIEILCNKNFIQQKSWNASQKTPLTLREMCRFSIRNKLKEVHPEIDMPIKSHFVKSMYANHVIIPYHNLIDKLPLPSLMKQFLNYWREKNCTEFDFYLTKLLPFEQFYT